MRTFGLVSELTLASGIQLRPHFRFPFLRQRPMWVPHVSKGATRQSSATTAVITNHVWEGQGVVRQSVGGADERVTEVLGSGTSRVGTVRDYLPCHGQYPALRRNSWKSTPIEGVAGNLVIQQERPPNETVAKSPSIRLFRAFVCPPGCSDLRPPPTSGRGRFGHVLHLVDRSRESM